MSEGRKCAKCGEVKDESQFSGKTNSYCKPCRNEYAREYNRKNPGVAIRAKARYQTGLTPEQRRNRNRTAQLWRFRLTPQQWDEMFERQGGRCAICQTDAPTGHGWHIDHDHSCCPEPGRSCGRCVRAILCSECNTGLGKFRDDPGILRAAIQYLERMKEN